MLCGLISIFAEFFISHLLPNMKFHSLIKLFTLCIAILNLSIAKATTYTADFEDASKGGYAAGTVTVAGIDWNFSDALIGNAANDVKNGAKSARLRGSGFLEMLTDKVGGAGTVSISFARYGNDNASEWKLEYSTNGGSTWTQAGSNIAVPNADALATQTFTVNMSGNVRLKITKTMGANSQRLNIDDVVIEDFAGVPTPTFNFAANNISVSENAGSVSVSVIQGLAQACQVSVVQVGGTAPAADYTFTSPAVLSFDGTNTTQSVNIPVFDNSIQDGNRTVVLALQTATNGCLVGTTAQITINITDNDVTGTTLYPGDIAIVAVNANVSGARDSIAFVNFVEILPGTQILFTDNGYERGSAANVSNNTWGNQEGVVGFTYVGTNPLPVGTINVFGNGTFGNGTAPQGWTRQQVSPVDMAASQGNFNMSTLLDQLFVMQGTWNDGTFPNNDATFSGRMLFGYSNTNWALSDQAVANTNSGVLSSRLPIEISCLNFASIALSETANAYKLSALRIGSKAALFSEIKDINNWQDSFVSQTAFTVQGSGGVLGTWTGLVSTDWFNGCNWELFQVPDENVSVVIPANAVNNPQVASLTKVAKCKNLTLQAGRLSVKGNAAYTLEVYGNLVFAGGHLDMDSTGSTTDGTIRLYGNWQGAATATFDAGKGRVIFAGKNNQTISGTAQQNFATLEVSKADSSITLATTAFIGNQLALNKGIIYSSTDKYVYFDGTANYVGGSDSSHINGIARKKYFNTGTFTFPIGKGGVYRPFGAETSGMPTVINEFFAEYFYTNPATAGFSGIDNSTGLCQVSDAEYWKFSQIIPTNAILTGYWGAGSTPVTNITNMLMARWNGTKWTSIGATDTSGNNTVGSVTSGTISLGTTEEIFTLGFASTLPTPRLTNKTICVGTTATFINTEVVPNAKVYWFATASSTDTLFVGNEFTTPALNANTTYYAATKLGDCQSARISVRAIVKTTDFTFPTDTAVIKGQSVTLVASGGATYTWAAANGITDLTSSNPAVSPSETTTYTLTITSAEGCSKTANVTVKVRVLNEVFVPNSFSPNGDNKNDVFEVYGNNLDTYELLVYNRLGNQVAKVATNESWNGIYENKVQTGETLVWTLSGAYKDGTTFAKKGSVVVLK